MPPVADRFPEATKLLLNLNCKSLVYLRDEVVVLKKTPYREQDRRYVMYGRNHGLMVAVARGALKPRAKQSGSLEPFSLANVMIAEGKGHDHLAVASQMPGAPRLKRLGSFAVAGAFADVCLSLLRTGISDQRIFVLWEDVLDCLSSLPQEPSAARANLMYMAACLRLMDILGYGPVLGTCLACRNQLPKADAVYAVSENGLVCPDCRTGWWSGHGQSLAVKSDAVSLLRLMRDASLEDLLRVTVPHDILQNAHLVVHHVLSHAPFEREPHGPRTIVALLG